jgi:adenylylsulfate kinase
MNLGEGMSTPICIWLTGLPGAGKTTIARALSDALQVKGKNSFILDGDELRQGLCSDLGMSMTDRAENIRRAGEVAKLMAKADHLVICAFVSPYIKDRSIARELFHNGEFLEVYLSTPVEVCSQRDPKGLYAKFRQGLISGLTGVDAPYEAPLDPDIAIDTSTLSIDDAVCAILTKFNH